jgi:alkanesulfonate monooxygenase SsuD/methylene tetrahydromethanopterin reductase-like flavin-dependent oxidoreductase (luciferase family)
VRVGTAIANAALRPPVLAAKTAAQLDQASGGRFLLGLGVANEVMNSRFGLPPFPALRMISEYTAVVRAVLAGRSHEGQLFRTGLVPLDSPPGPRRPSGLPGRAQPSHAGTRRAAR